MKAWALPLLLVATAVTTVAEAADSEGTQLLRRGIALRREHRDAEALTAFEAASLIEPSPCATAQSGLALFALRRWVEAEAHLKTALAQPDDAWVRGHLGALDGALASVASHLGWLRIESATPGAQVVIEGNAEPSGDVPTRVNAGTVSFLVRAAGYQTIQGEATVLPGALAQRAVALEPDAPPEGHPASQEAVHEIKEHAASESPVPTTSVPRDVEPRAASPWSVSVPLLVAGVAAVGVGAAFGWLALDARRTRDAHCSGPYCDATGLAADSDARARATAATINVGAGASAVVAAAIWLAVSHRSRIQWAPVAGAATGMVVKGDW